MSAFKYFELGVTVLVWDEGSFAELSSAMGAKVSLSELCQVCDRKPGRKLPDFHVESCGERAERFRILSLSTLNSLDCAQSNI
jgi:hypothetical protein